MMIHFESDFKEIKILKSKITCPECGHSKEETMPVDSCQIYYECSNCGTVLRPLKGDCCVFCSYGDHHCIDKQRQANLGDQPGIIPLTWSWRDIISRKLYLLYWVVWVKGSIRVPYRPVYYGLPISHIRYPPDLMSDAFQVQFRCIWILLRFAQRRMTEDRGRLRLRQVYVFR